MTLEDLERQGYIKKLPIDRKKVRDSLSLAERDIATATTLLNLDTDWAFSIAYNAMLQTLRAFMSSQGYRPDGGNQHVSTVRFAELFLDKDIVIVFDRMRRKRHISVYDTAGSISKTEAKTAIQTAEEILHIIKQRIHEK
jgi:uncharacterized protein (UPF0332 family)